METNFVKIIPGTWVTHLVKIFCEQCGKSSEKPTYYRNHDSACRKCGRAQKFECLRCRVQYKCYESLRSHIRYSGCCGEVFRCDHCQYRTMQKEYMQNHIQQRHGTDPDNLRNLSWYNCRRCAKRFPIRPELDRHMENCTGKNRCNLCNSNNTHFCGHLHIKNCNNKKEKKLEVKTTHTCPNCDKVYKYKSAFLSHVRNCFEETSSSSDD